MTAPQSRALLRLTSGLLLLSTVLLLPFASLQLGRNASFVPAWLAMVTCFDLLSVYLLVSDYLNRGDRRVLCLSVAYIWSLLALTGYALAFPGALAEVAPLAPAPSAAPWFYIAWHVGFPAMVGLAWAPWPLRWAHVTPTIRRRREAGRVLGVAVSGSLTAVVLLMLSVRHLPVLIVGLNTSAMTRLTAPVALPIVGASLWVTWRQTRARTGPERWAVVAVLACACDLVLTYSSRHRFSLGWYVGRSLTLVSAGAVLFATLGALRLAWARAEQDALVDVLTGLNNRRAGLRDLDLMVSLNRRTRSPLCVIMIDVDHFKRINDTHGHEAGDRVLAELGALLPRMLRASDVPMRYGGEEFLVVLPGTGLPEARQVAERLRLAVSHALPMAGGAPVTVSLGVAVLGPLEPPADLLRRADVAMYAAKQAGRNRVCEAPPPLASSAYSLVPIVSGHAFSS